MYLTFNIYNPDPNKTTITPFLFVAGRVGSFQPPVFFLYEAPTFYNVNFYCKLRTAVLKYYIYKQLVVWFLSDVTSAATSIVVNHRYQMPTRHRVYLWMPSRNRFTFDTNIHLSLDFILVA